MSYKIMIVDDAMFMRSIIRKNLQEIGFTEFCEAPDGETAIRLYGEEKPDLILLDITMPGLSGLEVLEEIMKINPEARIIMCSAIGQENMIQKAIIMGAKDFIVKPFKSKEIQRVVEAHMKG